MLSLPQLRLFSQRLVGTPLSSPLEVVEWMGAMQSQDFSMAVEAVALRLAGGDRQAVMDAFNRGDILRTHVLRPTWHFVAPKNIRWMLSLAASRIKTDGTARDRELGIDAALYARVSRLFCSTLEGGRHKTREELQQELKKVGIVADTPHVYHFLMRAETEGLLCSGPLQGKKQTWALLDERVSPTPPLARDEAVARLLRIYLTSHAPATLQDFTWWASISLTEAKRALETIRSKVVEDKFAGTTYYRYPDNNLSVPAEPTVPPTSTELLLPAYDEYVISYRDRSAILTREHHARAISFNGIFRPTIARNGIIVGLWRKKGNKISKEYF